MNRTQSQDRHTGWPTRPLGDVVETEISTWNTGSHPDEEKQYIEIASIDAASKTIARTHLVQGRTAPSRARTIVHAGDVLVATTRPNLNAVAIVPQELDGQVCSTGFAVLRPTESMTSKWLYWSVRSPAFVRTVSDLVVGAMYPAVTDKQVRSVVIPVPPVLNQQCIVAKLDEQMAALDRAEKALAEQQAAASALMTATLQQVFASPGSEQWPQSALSELCEFIRGVTFEQSEALPSPSEGHLPILRAGNITDTLALDSDLVWVPSRRVSPDQLLKSGDIVMCMSSGSAKVVGKSARVSNDWAGSAGAFCGILRPRNVVDANWLAFWLRSDQFTTWRDSQARGANIQNLRFSQMSDIVLRVPPIPEQRRIAAKLESARNGITAFQSLLGSQHAVLAALRATLLDVAFSGEI